MKRARYARLTAWIAAAAVLLAALAPGMARALSSPQQQMPWTEICSAAGMRVAHDPAPLSGSGQHDGMGLKHCPLCLNHIGQFALPVAFVGLPVAGVDTETVPAFTPGLFPRFLRAAVQPRGPPVNS